jgi:putative ABC transport system ATP-binding protein
MMIETRQLSKTFTTEQVETIAVRNVTLHINSGEFVAIMGPSGCGKSTLLHLLGLIDRCTEGDYAFHGEEASFLTERQMTRIRRERMGIIFQNFNLVDELNVGENVEFPLLFTGVKRRERKIRVMETLDSLKMSHRISHYPQQLSGGQQQRVAFARAIVNRPSLLLADEPTGNLDSHNSSMMLDLLLEHNKNGGTIVMVTHSFKDASYAHRIINMHDGEIKS